jgi:hypothetical protein
MVVNLQMVMFSSDRMILCQMFLGNLPSGFLQDCDRTRTSSMHSQFLRSAITDPSHQFRSSTVTNKTSRTSFDKIRKPRTIDVKTKNGNSRGDIWAISDRLWLPLLKKLDHQPKNELFSQEMQLKRRLSSWGLK